MEKKDINNYFFNKLGSVVIGIFFSLLVGFFLWTETSGNWQKNSSYLFEIAIVVILFFKCFSFIGWYLALEKYNETLPYKEVLVYGYAITIAISIIMLDYLVYPNYSIAALYTIIVPFGWFLKSRNGTIIIAILAIVLSFSIYFLKEDITDFSFFFSLRVTSLVVISMVAVFLRYFKIIKHKLRGTNKILNHKIIESELKEKELEQIFYSVSHDLKEPLRSLSVILDIFREGNHSILKDDDNELLGLVKNSAVRMGRSIQAMLEYSKLGQNFDLEYVSINKVMNDVVFEMNNIVKLDDVIIDIEDLGTLKIYLTDFRVMFSQLIDNSIQYKKKDENCKISISRKDIDGYAVFYLKDNGIGIEEINHERIFKIFQSINVNESSKGIGLAHCTKIAELHKGNISVESVFGEGSTFIIKISNQLV